MVFKRYKVEIYKNKYLIIYPKRYNIGSVFIKYY